MSKLDITKIEGSIIAETDKALLIKFKSGKQSWIPKSTISSEFDNLKKISQEFSIKTWVLTKNNILDGEDPLVKLIIEDLLTQYSDIIIAIYGIGSYFDKDFPFSWIKNDLDIVVIVKSLDSIPKSDWTDVRYDKSYLEGKEVWIGYNTLEGFQHKELFIKQSFSNYEWSVLDIKHPENSQLLHGRDIRDQLPETENLQLDYDDILARGLYHIEKSISEKDHDIARKEFSKGVFKTSFYFCIYFSQGFKDTSTFKIGKKLKEIVKVIKPLKDSTDFLQEVIIFRSTGQFITDFEKLRRDYLNYIFSLLKAGILHKEFNNEELTHYLSKYFGGFPLLIRFLKKPDME